MYSVYEKLKVYRTGPSLKEEGLHDGFIEDVTGKLFLKGSMQKGYYFMKAFDSQEEEESWNRLIIKNKHSKDIKFIVYILTSDNPFVEYEGEYYDIDELLQDTQKASTWKLEFLRKQGAKIYVDVEDILLHEFKGRYIWIALCNYNLDEENSVLESIEIQYPMQTFMDYLPEIYMSAGDFFKQYIGIFQSLYLDAENVIDRIEELFDIDTLPDEFLNYIGGWVGIDNTAEIFNNEQMRRLIKQAVSISRGKGTKKTLEKLIKIYTGSKPIIIEYFNWKEYVKNDDYLNNLYQKLYGEDFTYFTVIINKEKSSEDLDAEKLRLLIDTYKPAGSQYHLVLLEASEHSDRHCYLGINSYLASFESPKVNEGMRLDGSQMLRLQ